MPIDIGMARALVVAGKNERSAIMRREGAADAAGMKTAAMAREVEGRRAVEVSEVGGRASKRGLWSC